MLVNTDQTRNAPPSLRLARVESQGIVSKRLLDILGSAIALVILSPIFLLIVILIKLTSPGPVFFRWNVVGRGGKPFVGYKFRTMFNGADRMREQLREKNEMTGVFFKMK